MEDYSLWDPEEAHIAEVQNPVSCLIPLQAGNSAALEHVLRLLGGNDVWDYVESFMEDHPPLTPQAVE